MWVRMARFQLQPEKAEEAARLYAEVAAPRVRATGGNLGCYLLEPATPGDPHVACTLWESEAHAQAYEASGAAAEVAGLIRSAFAGPPELRSYRSRGRP
jgi:heme-degrading monooxygenase HmoA